MVNVDIKKLKTPILIDVRSPEEFEMQSIEDSINLPLDNILDGDPATIDILRNIKDNIGLGAEIWIYCMSGARSTFAKNFLTEQGFTNIVNKRSIFNI